MSLFFVAIENDFVEGQAFLFEADDLIGATMQALDFLRDLDCKTSEKIGEPEIAPSRIVRVEDTRVLWPNAEGIEKYLETIVVPQVEEDED